MPFRYASTRTSGITSALVATLVFLWYLSPRIISFDATNSTTRPLADCVQLGGGGLGDCTEATTIRAKKSHNARPTSQHQEMANATAGGKDAIQEELPPSHVCRRFPTPDNGTIIKFAQFSPKDFFQQGPGSSFLAQYEKRRASKPRFVLASHYPSKQKKSRRTEPAALCHWGYYHIHKNGGTNMLHYLKEVGKREEKRKQNADTNTTLTVEAYYGRDQHSMGSKAFISNIRHRISNIRPDALKWFTYLRDPIPRFLSSVREVLDSPRLRHVLKPCQRKKHGNRLLQCILDKMQEESSYLQIHLVPQAFELYNLVHYIYQDNPGTENAHAAVNQSPIVHVMDLKDMSLHRDMLFMPDEPQHTRMLKKKEKKSKKYILTTEKITLSMKRQICDLYAVDVYLLQETGIVPTECSALGDGGET